MLLPLFLALFLNAVLLWLLGRWLWRMRCLPVIGRWVMPTLILKLLVTGLSVGLLSEDGQYFQEWSGYMTDQLWQAPGQWLRMLLADEFHWKNQDLVFHGFSNTFFLMKLLSGCNLASLGNALLNGCYLSVFNFIGCWELVRQLCRRWSVGAARAGAVAFLAWPSVMYWTSGLTKESLLVGSGALLLALVIYLAYGPRFHRGRATLGLVASGLLHFKMRYFFAVVLFGPLAGLALTRALQQLGIARSRLAQAAVLLALLTAGGWVASQVSPAFRANKFTSQLQRNYSDLLKTSRNRPHLEYPNLRPTMGSVVRHALPAVLNTLARPWPWEGRSVLYAVAGLENLLLLAVAALAIVAALRGRAGPLPFGLVLALLLYCLILAALLGLTTPNLGTLNRYRVTFLPFLLLLLLQNDYAVRLVQWPGRRLRKYWADN